MQIAIDENWLVEPIVQQIANNLDERIEEKINELLTEKIRSIADETIKEKLAPMVSEVIAVGWQKTNNFGEPCGPTIGIRERISEFITKKDHYRKPWIEEKVEQMLNGDFRKEMDNVTAVFRKTVDQDVQVRLRKALADALGLRA